MSLFTLIFTMCFKKFTNSMFNGFDEEVTLAPLREQDKFVSYGKLKVTSNKGKIRYVGPGVVNCYVLGTKWKLAEWQDREKVKKSGYIQVHPKDEGYSSSNLTHIPFESIKRMRTIYSGDNPGCFVTTACVDYMGLPDNCFELEMLRRLRDAYLLQTIGGTKLVREYYQRAPSLVNLVREHPDSNKLFLLAFMRIKKTADLIAKKEYGCAVSHYIDTISKLENLVCTSRGSKGVIT